MIPTSKRREITCKGKLRTENYVYSVTSTDSAQRVLRIELAKGGLFREVIIDGEGIEVTPSFVEREIQVVTRPIFPIRYIERYDVNGEPIAVQLIPFLWWCERVHQVDKPDIQTLFPRHNYREVEYLVYPSQLPMTSLTNEELAQQEWKADWHLVIYVGYEPVWYFLNQQRTDYGTSFPDVKDVSSLVSRFKSHGMIYVRDEDLIHFEGVSQRARESYEEIHEEWQTLQISHMQDHA